MQETPVDSWVGKIPLRRDRLPSPVFLGFPCASAGKESAYNVGDLGSIPGLGRFPWRRERLSTPVFWPREFHAQYNWVTFFLFPPIIFISWRLITLQYCSGFCHTLTRISYGFTCVPHPNPPPASLPIPSLWVFPVHQPRAVVSCIQPGLETWVTFTYDFIHIFSFDPH